MTPRNGRTTLKRLGRTSMDKNTPTTPMKKPVSRPLNTPTTGELATTKSTMKMAPTSEAPTTKTKDGLNTTPKTLMVSG